ncbi:MAG TPA: hypothetical protein VMU75_02065 [Acidimicrobiales bacterium]|nr:hypothetical protein [Acidimicrobiales bacterium]
MSANLRAEFSAPPEGIDDAEYVRWCEAHLDEVLAADGFVAARLFAVRPVLGGEIPAQFPFLALYEVEGDPDPLRGALERERARTKLPDWFGGIRFASWTCLALGDHGGVVLPEHLYMNFNAAPDSMPFDDYSDWYEEHQADNIANTPVLVRGWRFRLLADGPGSATGPTHLALYELDGDVEQMAADLGRAMVAGTISLPDWFRRYASLDASAIGGRLSAPR